MINLSDRVLEHVCPACGAGVGQSCTSKLNPKSTNALHDSRIRLAFPNAKTKAPRAPGAA